MSYSISISGHNEGESAQAKEEAIVIAARGFVAGLEGISSATFSGSVSGPIDLRRMPETDAVKRAGTMPDESTPCLKCGGVTQERDGARYCDGCNHKDELCTCEPVPTRGVGSE